MLQLLNKVANEIDLNINFNKTKIMSQDYPIEIYMFSLDTTKYCTKYNCFEMAMCVPYSQKKTGKDGKTD